MSPITDPAPGAPPQGASAGSSQTTGPRRTSRLRQRLASDLREALIDPSLRPSGDFGIVDEAGPGRGDRVASFQGLITAMRLTTTAISVLLVSAAADTSLALRGWTAVIAAYAVLRCFRPITYSHDVQSLLRVVAEVGLHVAAIIATGAWESPLVFSLLTAVTVAGVARGFGFSLRVALATVLSITFPFVLAAENSRDALAAALPWCGVVLSIAIVAGYVRRLSGDADRERELALDRLDRLADANDLLFSLHRLTQTLPASFDLDEVLDSTINRLKTLISFDSIAVLLYDETDAKWEVARHQGLAAPPRLEADELPFGLRKALGDGALVDIADLARQAGGGLSPRAGSGVYTVLCSRGATIGLLAIEHGESHHFTTRDKELVEGFVAPAALAVDNARWFARLRTVGADEERTRIARDLHDRIGQSLAYLGFEVDRLVEKDANGDALTAAILQLRDDVRGVVREVRDTLYDLRTDVSEDQGLADVLSQYLSRVEERSGIKVQVDVDREGRLPILQEREMWRVAQEALTNVERHARASAVRVVWHCDGQRAVIDITDNGVGFEKGRAGRMDSYGLMGMRERASSIGATLDVISAPGRGTRVRCSLAPTGQPDVRNGSASTIVRTGAGFRSSAASSPAGAATSAGRQ